MQFRSLEYFVVLARERHFARAAAACYVSQPALSEAVRKLEHELGVPLVKRGHNFQGLTPEGERVLVWARRILADQSALEHEVAALQAGLTGDLRLGVIPAASSTAAGLVDRFCAQHPLVHVRLETSLRSSEITERIRTFDLDAGIVYLEDQNASDLLVQPLYVEQQVLVAGDDLVRADTESLDWQDAMALPLCLLNEGMRGRQVIDEAVAAHGLTAQPRIETDSVVSLLALVATGRWASIVPLPWLRALEPPANVRIVRLEGLTRSRIAVVAHDTTPGSILPRAFLEVAASDT